MPTVPVSNCSWLSRDPWWWMPGPAPTTSDTCFARGEPHCTSHRATFTCQSQFSGGALLLVLCSNTYDVADYIEAEEFFAGSRYSSTPEAMGARADG